MVMAFDIRPYSLLLVHNSKTFVSINDRQPKKLGVTLSRRSRRVTVDPKMWEPTMKNPLKGMVVWPVPETKEIAVTVFKDPRTEEYEDKEWTIIIEDVSLN